MNAREPGRPSEGSGERCSCQVILENWSGGRVLRLSHASTSIGHLRRNTMHRTTDREDPAALVRGAKIEKIAEVHEKSETGGAGGPYSGYEILLDNGVTVSILIEDRQQCCEQYGYLTSDDNLPSYVGAMVLRVVITDRTLKMYPLLKMAEEAHGSVETIFCTVYTDRGNLQFVAYNGHNGYYGHTVLYKIGQNVQARQVI